MKIRITRSTVAKPLGEAARAVDPGDVIEVDDNQGNQLVTLGKALRVVDAAAPAGGMQTPEDALTPMEVRTSPKRRKG